MARPLKCRRIGGPPQADYFKPRGVSLADLPEVHLTMDEFEAVRLADLLGLYQEEAAKRMDVSRQTFGNIIESARKKIADAIVNAKALKIEGGVVKMRQRLFSCADCRHDWSAAFGSARPPECPKCRSRNFQRAPRDGGWVCGDGFGKGRGSFCRRMSK
jgi:predicted DNA-binding protein (UPF0251 family)